MFLHLLRSSIGFQSFEFYLFAESSFEHPPFSKSIQISHEELTKTKATRKWLVIDKHLSVAPGVNASLGHHASWEVSGCYVTVCHIDNHIPLDLIKNRSDESGMQQASPLLESTERRREPYPTTFKITNVLGFLTLGEDDGESATPNFEFAPVELSMLCCEPPSEVVVPFGRSIQLLYSCNPFASRPFEEGQRSFLETRSSVSLSPLTHMLAVVKSVQRRSKAHLKRTIQNDRGKSEPPK